jgi:hypothetical protein
MSASRYYNRVWDAINATMRQVEAGNRFEINADGSGTLFTWNGDIICQFGTGHLLPCTGVCDMKGITLYDGDYVSEPGSEIIRTVTWINGAYYLVAKRADKELDSVRIDAADTMLHRGNIFQGLA